MTDTTSNQKSWYVVRVFTGHENEVKTRLTEEAERANLVEQLGEILIPTETIMTMKDGKKKEKNKVFFPGYIMVQVLLDPVMHHLISNSTSVIGFAGNARNPQPLLKD
jgi:transcriptional antiterminator NusG